MFVTVFTTTYNRAHLLEHLYESLLTQTNKNFEWLVVDDGSTDNTEELFREWIKEKSFPVRYIKQANGGKHRAINKGVKEANGELFFIVDSDDQLTCDAIDVICSTCNKNSIKGAGLCYRKCDITKNKVLGASFPKEGLVASSLELTYRYNILGDKAEIFYTSVLKEFPFPEFVGEKFVPESLVWNRIALKYKMVCYNKPIYLCEYLNDGLSSQFSRLRKENPRAYSLYYKEVFIGKYTTFNERLKALIRCAQCCLYILILRTRHR